MKKIYVLQQDINNGKRLDPSSCPIALALRRQLHNTRISVSGTTFTIKDNFGNVALNNELPKKVKKFIEDFDFYLEHKTEPIIFELEDHFFPINSIKLMDGVIKKENNLIIEEEIVKVRAYYIWQNNGSPFGRDLEFYYQALNEIREQANSMLKEMQELDNKQVIKDDIAATLELYSLDFEKEVHNKLQQDYITTSEEINPEEIMKESDDNWYSDIELLMPEIKTMKFRNVSQKLSWLFNNLKAVKARQQQESQLIFS
jgi:Protein of unknown function (DUF2934)